MRVMRVMRVMRISLYFEFFRALVFLLFVLREREREMKSYTQKHSEKLIIGFLDDVCILGYRYQQLTRG